MAIFYNHAKVSKTLRDMAYSGDVYEDIQRAIPAKYYPRIDNKNDREFLLRLAYRFGSRAYPFVEIFTQRGMDWLAQDREGNTWLHLLMKECHDSDTAFLVGKLFDSQIRLPLQLQNNEGKYPLDVFKGYEHHFSGRFIKMVLGEAVTLYGPHSKEYKQQLYDRFMQRPEWFSAEDIAELVKHGVTLDMRNGGWDSSMLMRIMEKCSEQVIKGVLSQDTYPVTKTHKPLLATLIQRNVNADVVMLAVKKHGYEVTRDHITQAIEKRNVELLEFLYAQHKSRNAGNKDYLSTLSSQVFDQILRVLDQVVSTASFHFIIEVLKRGSVKGGIDINTVIMQNGRNLFLGVVEYGSVEQIEQLISMGADIRLCDAKNISALDIAHKRKDLDVIACLKRQFKKLNQRGDFERVHETQITCKTGVLTYIFDFYAGQVVVRDNETKNVAAQPFAEFAKSGAALLDQAADTLKALGGNTNGFNAAPTLSVSAIKKTALSMIPKPSS